MQPEPGRLRPYLEQLQQLVASGGSHVAQEFISHEQRRTAYARRLIWWFSQEGDLVNEAMAALQENTPVLEQILRQEGGWDGQIGITLADAIWDGFNGLTTLEQCTLLWEQVWRLHTSFPELRKIREQAAGILAGAALRAPWTGPLMVAAWLRHLAFRRYAPNLPGQEFHLWPAGSQLIRDLPPGVTIVSEWDPEGETMAHARQRLLSVVEARLEVIHTRYATTGFEEFRVRNLERDVLATYLRVRWRCSWAEIGRRASKESGVACSAKSIERAVSRVFALLEIEPPRVPPGRPRRISPHSN